VELAHPRQMPEVHVPPAERRKGRDICLLLGCLIASLDELEVPTPDVSSVARERPGGAVVLEMAVFMA
jgi:hypothetical protein